MRVRVRSRAQAGFRRAGLYWPATWTETEVDEGVLATLKSEPMLVVCEVSDADSSVPDTRTVQPVAPAKPPVTAQEAPDEDENIRVPVELPQQARKRRRL